MSAQNVLSKLEIDAHKKSWKWCLRHDTLMYNAWTYCKNVSKWMPTILACRAARSYAQRFCETNSKNQRREWFFRCSDRRITTSVWAVPAATSVTEIWYKNSFKLVQVSLRHSKISCKQKLVRTLSVYVLPAEKNRHMLTESNEAPMSV